MTGSLTHGQTAGVIFKQHHEEGKDAQFVGIVVVYAADNVEEVRTASVKTSMPRAGGGFLKKFRYSQLTPYAWESQTDT